MLRSLTIEDFKSFRGKQTIGPFKMFTAVIGPNGSGKSNLMDAISFALGAKANELRVRKVQDLIHGSVIGRSVSKTCEVTATFVDDKEEETAYTRRVHGAASEYYINGEAVQREQYKQSLQDRNIFTKVKNYCVFQGQIEQVAMMKPKDRTALIEEISRSSELAGEYEHAKAEMIKAELAAQTNMHQRRGIAVEKREARLEREEAEKFQQLREELSHKQQLVQLMELFRVEHNIEQAEKEYAERNDNVKVLKAKRNAAEGAMLEKQKVLHQMQKELGTREKAVNIKEREIAQKNPQWVHMDQEVKHHAKKLELAKKGHDASRRAADSNADNLKNFLQKQADIKSAKAQKEAEYDTLGQLQQMNLSATQIDEYIQLKKEAGKQAGVIDTQLANLIKEDDEERAQIEYEQKRMQAIEARCKNKEAEEERYRNQMASLSDQKQETEKLIATEDRNIVGIEQSVIKSKEDIEKVSKDLEAVSRELADAQGDTAEGDRERRRKEAVENLMRIFPDKVYGRLHDLCSPSHKRYQLAVTKVLQKHMNSIVCDNEETGRNAIYYLKEQRYPPETFLPLISLEVRPLNQKLRALKQPTGAKLVYDVIQTTHNPIKKALQFACGNALVCENADDARFLAYGEAGDRYKAVSLDGTLYSPNGPISGGGADLRKHARKWDEAGVRNMKKQRDDLYEELTKLRRTRDKELDVEMKRNSMKSLQARLKYIHDQMEQISQRLQKAESELETTRGELELIPLRISEVQGTIDDRQKRVNELREKSDKVANKVFASFCKRIGVKNIREYEDRDMRFHEEKKAAMLEFDRELDRIQLEVDYLLQDEKEKKAQNEKDKMSRLEKEMKRMMKQERELKRELDGLGEEMDELHVKVREQRTVLEKVEAVLAEAKKEVQMAIREVTQADKATTSLIGAVHRWRRERHRLLNDAKINQIKIPLTSGSMAVVDGDETYHSQDASTSTDADVNISQASKEQLKREEKIKVNYCVLPVEYRMLETEDGMKKVIHHVMKEIETAQEQLGKVHAPNLKANERLEDVKEKEAKANQHSEQARNKAQKARREFEKIKTERYRRFNDYFEPMSQKIDEMYKMLSRDGSAQAFLGADNMEEPYMEGIQYNCIAPGKRFRPMDSLSGGEKTIAALALLFAMHSRSPSPFFVLDEIDAALDNTNIGKVASFIMDSAARKMQLIVISLKEEFYNKADGLVGIYRIPDKCTVSGVATLDLNKYRVPAQEQNASDDSTMRTSGQA